MSCANIIMNNAEMGRFQRETYFRMWFWRFATVIRSSCQKELTLTDRSIYSVCN